MSELDDRVQAYAREAARKAMLTMKKVYAGRYGEDVLTTCVDTAIERVPFQFPAESGPDDNDAARWEIRITARAAVLVREMGDELQAMSVEASKMSMGGVS